MTLPALISSSDAGDERYDYDPLGRLIRVVDEQNRVTEYVYDPAGNLLRVITGGTATAPIVTGISPDALRRGESKRITATGTGLIGARLSTSDPALQITDVQGSATQIGFTLNALDTAILGPQPITFTNAAGSTSAAVIVNPTLPKTTVVPAPLAIPPDNISRQFTIRLSNADNIAHSFALSSANTAVATVSPASVTIPAGQTEVPASITGRLGGQTTITLASTTLGTTLFPVFVTAEFRGINTSLAPLVGVVVEQVPQPKPPQTITPFSAPHLGVVVGGYIQAINPKALVVGTGPSDLTITGKALSGVTAIAIKPADGVTLGSFSVNAEGTAITVPVTVAANAPQTMRQLALTAGTQIIPPAAPDADRVFVAPPAPQVTSVDPLFVLPGTPSQTMVVRGRFFRNLQRVQVTPSTGIVVDAAPVVNADQTELTLKLAISPIAPLGPRVVTVTTASGTSSATQSPENTFTIVNELKDTFTPIVAAVVGVLKQTEPAPPASQTIGLVASHLGISVGSVVTGITPAAESIGQTFTLTVQGFELQNVTALKFVPDTGITIGALAVAADGRSATVPITLALDAPLTLRTVQVLVGTTVLPAAPAAATQFRVTTPTPEVNSVSPNFVQLGAPAGTHTVRGKNFHNALQVKLVPPDGVTISPPTVNSGATEIAVTLSAAANAVKGKRAVVVVTPVGETSSTLTPANTLILANDAETVTPVVAANVGVVVEQVPQPVSTPIGPIASATLGVVVQQNPPPPAPTSIYLTGAQLGIAVGPVSTGVSPAGIARGTSGTLTIQGSGLSGVTAIALEPSTGITLGALQINVEGSQVSVPITVAVDAVTGLREVRLSSGSGAIAFSNPAAGRFYIAAGAPQIDSITPILATQGSTLTLLIRGSNFQSATVVTATPAAGIVFGGPFVVNSSGTEITIPMFIPVDAPLGSRVIRVTTPAATTTADSVPANTFTVFPP